MNNLKPRTIQRSEIIYVLLTDEDPRFLPFLPPSEFRNYIISFISRLPKDVLQLGGALQYYELSLINNLDNPYRFHVRYAQNLEEYLEFIPPNMLFLFFIDVKSKLINKVVSQLTENHNELRFYHFINDAPSDKRWFLPNLIDTPGGFLKLLLERQERLFSLLRLPSGAMEPAVAIGWEGFYQFPNFVPAHYNYHIANSITGNFNFAEAPEDRSAKEEKLKKNIYVSAQSHSAAHSFTRQQQIIEQKEKIDYFSLLCREENIIKPVHAIDPVFPPLIIVIPFQNPDLKEYFNKTKAKQIAPGLLTALQMEQTENYINANVDVKHIRNEEDLIIAVEFVHLKTKYLDDMAFLHSSFNFSPVIRLPGQGKTLYRKLSFFRNESSIRLTASGNRRKIFKTIQSFGKQLKIRTVSPKLAEKLQAENRQIVVISDLPFEWLDLDGIPLAFTHDVCRLPETALHGLMANFTNHEQRTYTIPNNILKNTLVVFGSDEPAFKVWHPQVEKMASDYGISIRKCFSIADLKNAIKEVKPHLLIIDSHGNYDPVSKSTYLCLGNERLTGELVVQHEITAPLVFLSACNTSPTYGTINTIANAFFEVGSMVVTTTYLPINIHTGTILYLRLINNLHLASTTSIHSNWLAFISHLLRTSAVGATYNESRKKNWISSDKLTESQTIDYTYLLSFYERRGIFEKLDKQENIKISETIPEFLFYSILGRADLIYFDSWLQVYKKKNSDHSSE